VSRCVKDRRWGKMEVEKLRRWEGEMKGLWPLEVKKDKGERSKVKG
jgi:hypothetical protein